MASLGPRAVYVIRHVGTNHVDWKVFFDRAAAKQKLVGECSRCTVLTYRLTTRKPKRRK